MENAGNAIQFANDECWSLEERKDILPDAVETDGIAVLHCPEFSDYALAMLLSAQRTFLGHEIASHRLKEHYIFVHLSLDCYPQAIRHLLCQMSQTVLEKVINDEASGFLSWRRLRLPGT